MFKKIGVGLLLAFTMLITGLNVQTGTTFQAYACSTLAECREQAQQATNNIANLTGAARELSAELVALQEQIELFEEKIDALLEQINGYEQQIDAIAVQMRELQEDIEATRETIEETDEEIEDLIQLISQRMRATQRFNNRNSMLSQLSNADNLNDFVLVIRQAQRAVASDADLMEELIYLIESNRNRYEALQVNVDVLSELTEHFRDLQANVEIEMEVLEELKLDLWENRQRLQDRLDSLYADRHSAEDALALARRMERILQETPPPPVVTQTPNASGLAHPMPGARVSSEFGPRWGGHHGGIDLEIFSQPRTPILAAASGVVTLAEWHWSMGWWIIITHNINGQRVDTVYAHLRYAPPVSPGQIVSQGQVIGTKGSTGVSTGAHLHFEVHPHPDGFAWNRGVNPRLWITF